MNGIRKGWTIDLKHSKNKIIVFQKKEHKRGDMPETTSHELLDYLVERICNTGKPSSTEEEVMDAIHDMELEEDIPNQLLPTPKPSNPLIMTAHERIPPWIMENAPFVLRRLTEETKEKICVKKSLLVTIVE